MVDGGERLVSLLKKAGPEAVVDINQALLCHSLDVIGQVGSPSAARHCQPCTSWQLPSMAAARQVSGQGLCLCCSDFDCMRLWAAALEAIFCRSMQLNGVAGGL